MSDTYSLVLQGYLCAEQPLATSPPGSNTTDSKVQQLPKMAVEYQGQRITVPYFPGAGLRGKLRRCAVDVILGVYPDGFQIRDFYYLTIGGVKGDEAEDKNDLSKTEARRKANPLIGLFGSSTPWYKGRAQISHAIPAEPVAANVINGVRTDDFMRQGGRLEVLSAAERPKYIEMAQANSKRSRLDAQIERQERDLRIARSKGDAKEALEKRIADIELLKAEREDALKAAFASNSVQTILAGYEVIPQGVRLAQKINLEFVNEDEIGLFFLMMNEFALNPMLGAHANHNCGLVSGKWSVKVRKNREPRYVDMGELTLSPNEPLDTDIALFTNSADKFQTKLDQGDYDFGAPGSKDAA